VRRPGPEARVITWHAAADRGAPAPGRRYRIGAPDSVRAMTSRWISLVPSKIV
jgi:hypothetical protein